VKSGLIKAKFLSLLTSFFIPTFNFVIINAVLYTRTYGIVYKAQNKVTGTYVAIKKFKDSDDDEYVSENADLKLFYSLVFNRIGT